MLGVPQLPVELALESVSICKGRRRLHWGRGMSGAPSTMRKQEEKRALPHGNCGKRDVTTEVWWTRCALAPLAAGRAARQPSAVSPAMGTAFPESSRFTQGHTHFLGSPHLVSDGERKAPKGHPSSTGLRRASLRCGCIAV